MKLKKTGAKISSINDISGSYVMMYYDLFDSGNAVFCEVTITKTSGNTYKISGFWGSWASDLTGTVDPDNYTLTVPRQELYRYEGDGHIEAADLAVLDEDALDLGELEATNASLVFEVYQDGVYSEDYWGAVITEYSDNGVTEEDAIGQYFAAAAYAYLFEPSGTMTWTPIDTSTGEAQTPETVSVLLTQSNDTVSIINFYGLGSTVYAVLAEGRTFAIPPQVIYTSSNGDFKTSEILSWYNDDEYTDITGTGTETTLTDNLEMGWTAGTATGYWIGWNTNLVITRTDGEEFVWPGEEVVTPDVYILGEVGTNLWAPNVGQKMEYDAEKDLYTAEIECDGRNSENGEQVNYFSFTTKLADNADDWDGIAADRFGAVADGENFWVTNEWLDKELSLTNGQKSFRIPKGKYDLTLSYTDMYVIIAKQYETGDVNGDGSVNVVDITALIDAIMNDDTSNPRADVNGDGTINVVDITALIDIIMNM